MILEGKGGANDSYCPFIFIISSIFIFP